jgi:hypothetical protein
MQHKRSVIWAGPSTQADPSSTCDQPTESCSESGCDPPEGTGPLTRHLLYYFVGMGLGWTGLWWYLTLLQGGIRVVVAGVALGRKPAAALLVPPISLGLMFLFVLLDGFVAARVCSPRITAAADELGAIPGFTQRPEFLPEVGKGCVMLELC